MKSKKKLIFSIISIFVLVVSFISGSYAYFTDSVTTHSVIVAGSVSIKQYETDRNGNPTNYSDILLLPAVTTNTVDETKVINGNSYNFKNYKNIVDKVVTLENEGKNDVYARTIILVPKINDKNLVGLVYNDNNITWEELDDVVVDDKDHVMYVATYVDKIAPNQKSAPSLMQVYLSFRATSADIATIPEGKIKIKIVSQAIQYSGFEDVTAKEALDEGFGQITRYSHPFKEEQQNQNIA